MSTATMAITTSNSIKVKPLARHRIVDPERIMGTS
jgi:hypothetical protein